MRSIEARAFREEPAQKKPRRARGVPLLTLAL